MRDITVGVKSFLRTDRIDKCLSSMRGKGFREVIVADDGPIDQKKRKVYDKHKKELPLKVLELERDTGISYGRNRAFRESDTPYFLLLDDDQEINGGIGLLRRILEENEEIGGVSGFWRESKGLRCSACNLHEYKHTIVKDADSPKYVYESDDYSFYVFDQINNSTLFRSEVIEDISWDPFYKIGREHEDFYLNHKRNSEWKFAVTPNVIINHYPSSNNSSYSDNFRSNDDRLQRSRNYFRKKWSINKLFLGTYFKNNTRYSIKQKLFSLYVKHGVPEVSYYITEEIVNLYKRIAKE